jgi:hypothetical protein
MEEKQLCPKCKKPLVEIYQITYRDQSANTIKRQEFLCCSDLTRVLFEGIEDTALSKDGLAEAERWRQIEEKILEQSRRARTIKEKLPGNSKDESLELIGEIGRVYAEIQGHQDFLEKERSWLLEQLSASALNITKREIEENTDVELMGCKIHDMKNKRKLALIDGILAKIPPPLIRITGELVSWDP